MNTQSKLSTQACLHSFSLLSRITLLLKSEAYALGGYQQPLLSQGVSYLAGYSLVKHLPLQCRSPAQWQTCKVLLIYRMRATHLDGPSPWRRQLFFHKLRWSITVWVWEACCASRHLQPSLVPVASQNWAHCSPRWLLDAPCCVLRPCCMGGWARSRCPGLGLHTGFFCLLIAGSEGPCSSSPDKAMTFCTISTASFGLQFISLSAFIVSVLLRNRAGTRPVCPPDLSNKIKHFCRVGRCQMVEHSIWKHWRHKSHAKSQHNGWGNLHPSGKCSQCYFTLLNWSILHTWQATSHPSFSRGPPQCHLCPAWSHLVVVGCRTWCIYTLWLQVTHFTGLLIYIMTF